MQPKSFLTIALSALALAGAARAQVTFEARASDPSNGDGTAWFQSVNGTSKGFVQLATHRLTAGAAALQGIHSCGLLMGDNALYAMTFKDGVMTSSAAVPDPAGGPLLACAGVATFQGGYVVTLTAGVPTAIRPHAGALVWTRGANPSLYVIELSNSLALGGALNVQTIFAGSVFGAAMIASKIEDINASAAILDSHVVAESIVYTAGNLTKIHADLSDGAFGPVLMTQVLDAGAAIPNVLGVAELNSGFNPGTVPSTPEGAAVVWTAQQVYLYESRLAASPVITPVTAAGAPIVGTWAVATLHTRSYSGAIPAATANLEHAFQILDANSMFSAKGIVAVENLVNNAPFPTSVVIPANPLIKRQAGSLYEIQARSVIAADQSRGFVIAHNQRSR